MSGQEFEIRAKKTVFATGPWTDEHNNQTSENKLILTKGVHLVFKHKVIPIKQSIYFDAPDGRMIFAIPRNDCTYVGTTDTEYNENTDRPKVNQDDVRYILNAINLYFEKIEVSQSDIISSWAGLRPLIKQKGKAPLELSRKDEIFEDKSGVIKIAGGKLTGYRLMAKKVVDIVCYEMNLKHQCNTDSIQLIGGEFDIPNMVNGYITSVKSRLRSFKIDDKKAEYLVRNYGKQTNDILDNYKNGLKKDIVQSEAWYCLRYESVCTLLDFFERRTAKLLFAPDKVMVEASLVINDFVEYLDWDEDRSMQELNKLKSAVQAITTFS